MNDDKIHFIGSAKLQLKTKHGNEMVTKASTWAEKLIDNRLSGIEPRQRSIISNKTNWNIPTNQWINYNSPLQH